MKKIFLFLLFAFSLSPAQYLVEDNDDTQNTKEIAGAKVSFEIKNPLEHYRLKCDNPTYAQPITGNRVFKDHLAKSISAHFDDGAYFIHGIFEFVFQVDKEGNLKEFVLKPQVANSELLQRDLKAIIARMNLKWKPATCNGEPQESKLRQRIDFRTDYFDL